MVRTRQFRRRRSGGRWAVALVFCGTALLLAVGPAGHLAFAGGAVSVSQSFGAANASAGTTLAATTSTATGSGDLLVATIRDRDTTALATVMGVTDSANDTWVEATRVSQGSQADEEIWYLANAPSVTSVTVTVSGSSALALTVIDVTGASSTALDVTATAGGSGTTASTGTTATTAVADEIAVADIGWNAQVTPSAQTAGYTTQSGVEQSTASGEAAGEQAAWQVLSSTGAQSYGATLSSSVAWTGAIATFELGASSSPTPTPAPTTTPPHIMVIVEENQEYGDIIGSSNAPYINSLASTYTSATNWYAVEHNSPTDYLDLISGSDQGLGGTTKKTPPFSATNLVDELHSANIPWQAYMESMPSGCWAKGSNGLYDPIHNPFHYFTNYGSYCTSGSSEGVVPYPGSSGLVTALDGSNPPDFVFITPNLCDDMHGSTTGSTTCASDSGSQLITAGDTWLKDNLGPVLNSTWFQNNGVLIVTWDEGTTKLGLAGGSPPDDGSCTSPNVPECGGHIPTLVIASKAAGSFTSGGDHYGALRGIEEAYGVGLLGHSSGTNDGDLEPAFGLSSSTTGGVTGQVTDQTDPSHPAISGAQVTCSCGGTLTTTTYGSGDYGFTNVTPGSGYSLSFSDTGYTTETIGSFSVTAGSTTTENEALPETGGVVSGTVTDATAPGNPPINGATVTCNCTSTPTTTTDSLGDYKFTQVTPGTAYTMSVSATGYTTGGSGSFTVTGGQATTGIDVSLAETGGVVSGTVTDANTSAAISGATVTCNCTSAPTTTTNSSGDYEFAQVTPGSGYTISVTAPSYLSGSSGTFTVTGGTATTGIDVSLTPSPATLGVAQSFGAANLTSGTTLSALTGTPTGSGDLLVAAIRDRNATALATVTAVTDSAGNKWVRAAGVGKGQADGEIWYAAGATGVSSVTVTVTSASAIAFTVLDLSGASSSPLDVTATAAGSGTTASTGATGTTSRTAEIAVADIGWNAQVTPSAQTAEYTTQSGVEQSTVGGEYAGEQAAWQVLSSTGAQSYGATLSSSVAWTGVIATFEAS